LCSPAAQAMVLCCPAVPTMLLCCAAAQAMLLGIWGSLVVWCRLWMVLGPSSLTVNRKNRLWQCEWGGGTLTINKSTLWKKTPVVYQSRIQIRWMEPHHFLLLVPDADTGAPKLYQKERQ
jgi:hypothetical protein